MYNCIMHIDDDDDEKNREKEEKVPDFPTQRYTFSLVYINENHTTTRARGDDNDSQYIHALGRWGGSGEGHWKHGSKYSATIRDSIKALEIGYYALQYTST